MSVINLLIRTEMEAVHNWSTIPEKHTQSYLKYPHRHMFHITVRFRVEDQDRELEFIEIKKRLNQWLAWQFKSRAGANPIEPFNIGSTSCEMLADRILHNFKIGDKLPNYVCVLEDGENGAEVYND